jgi:hypothetical protein
MYAQGALVLPPMPQVVGISQSLSTPYLQSITLPPSMLNCTGSAANGTASGSALTSITYPPLPAATGVFGLIQNSPCLISVTVPSAPKVTNATKMFYANPSLQTINLPTMPLVTTATSMFQNCYALQTINNLAGVGTGATAVQGDSMFNGCEQLTSISLPNTKFSVLHAAGASGKLNKLQTLTFSASSTFAYATPPQIDVGYTTMTAAQLNALFTSLPTVSSGQKIRIFGSSGAGTCTQSIATNLGWTVNNSS